MIYECPQGHICFSKDNLDVCGMKGCNRSTLIIDPININWFYKISETGLCINRSEIHKIIEDPNMPKDVKKQIQKVFMQLSYWESNLGYKPSCSVLFIRISQLQYAKDGRKDLGGSIAEELDTHKCRRIEDYRIKDDILWVFDGEKWIPRKLSPTESQQRNKTTGEPTEPLFVGCLHL